MKKLSILSIYSFGHFYIDFVCAFVFSLMVLKNPDKLESIEQLILLYNIIAFGIQPFFGFLIDYYHYIKIGAIIGLLTCTFGLIFFFHSFIASILLGFGNAIYHVSGGVVALNLDSSKAKYAGIYVAPGALGLFLGGILGYYRIEPKISIITGVLVVLCLGAIIIYAPVPKIIKYKKKQIDFITVILLLLLLSICMRSLIGFSLNLPWKSKFILGLFLTTGIVSGKFLGGILADKFGFLRIGAGGLIIAAPLLTFFQTIPVIIFIGAFCFNLVMPVTLTAIAQMMPNYKGLAFGLTTLSLVIGYLLYLILRNHLIIGYVFTGIMILINFISLYLGLKFCKSQYLVKME